MTAIVLNRQHWGDMLETEFVEALEPGGTALRLVIPEG